MSSYNLDSDDSEEEDHDQEQNENLDGSSGNKGGGSILTWKPQDIEKLKQQTSDLVNPIWKETRVTHLVQKLLELDQPLITHKMVDFLLQEGATQALIGFITQITPPDQPKQPRPAPTDTQSNAMKYAYRAVILLSPENPSDALNSFLSKRAILITTSIFDIFSTSSLGSFYHAYRIIECLLRCYPQDVYNGLLSDGKVGERMSALVSYIGFPPACELLVMLVAFTPVPRATQLYQNSAQARAAFFEALLRHQFLYQIALAIVNPTTVCCVDAYVDAGQHSSVGSQFLQEIIDKLSMEDTGEELLRTIAETTLEVEYRKKTDAQTIEDERNEVQVKVDEVGVAETTDGEDVSSSSSPTSQVDDLKDSKQTSKQSLCLIDMLINSVVTPTQTEDEDCYRRSSAKILCFLLRKAAEMEVISFVAQNSGIPAPVYIPNRLYACRESIVNIVRSRLDDITASLLSFDQFPSSSSSSSSSSNSSHVSCSSSIASSGTVASTKYSAYEVPVPFSTVRSLIIELVVLMAESDETVAGLLPVELWRLLVSWVILYSHNNIYHALMYRLVFAVLRQGQELPQRALFQKVKFASFLVDNFVPYEVDKEGCSSTTVPPVDKKLPEYRTMVNRIAARGFIMNCANAIRLQVSCQVASSSSSSSFLPALVNSHQKWQEFLPVLSVATDIQLKFGMGIKVSSSIDGIKGGGERGGMSMLISEPLPEASEDSRYAKSLGFYDEEAYSLNGSGSMGGQGEEEEEESEDGDNAPETIIEMAHESEDAIGGGVDGDKGDKGDSESNEGSTGGIDSIAAIEVTEVKEVKELPFLATYEDFSDAESTVSELSTASQD